MQVYGPVPSRRLGNSLGVSLIPPKVCSYSCVYCQIGKTDKYTIEPKSYYNKNEIIYGIEEKVNNSKIDYITFAGDGEPTLSSDLGWILKQCKEHFDIPTAVITNGSMLFQKDVYEALKFADLVLPSIDAGSEEVFKKINRPHKDLDFQMIIDSITDFKRSYFGKIWTETMLVKDYNDDYAEINRISAIIKKINPEKSFVMTPTRPPQIKISKPNPDALFYAQMKISRSICLDYSEDGDFDTSNFETLQDALENISSRHPLRLEQAEIIAKNFTDNITDLLKTGTFIIRNYSKEKYIIPSYLLSFRGQQ